MLAHMLTYAVTPKARLAAANIHLTHRHDKKTYIRYFEVLTLRALLVHQYKH